MNDTPTLSLETVLNGRRNQIGFRLCICGLITGCYGDLIGWPVVAVWCGLYACLQVLEMQCFRVSGPQAYAVNERWTASFLALLSVNSLAFGSLAPYAVLHVGPWGEVCGALLLAGAILNTVLTTIGCRAALAASLAPFCLYMCALPVAALNITPAPSNFVVLCISVGGILFCLTSVRLWHEFSQTKEAEAAAVQRDLAERAANERRLLRLAHLDALTGLGNRAVLQTRLAELVAAELPGALLIVDLDGFKYVNDTLGHSAGDRVLQDVAARITEWTHQGDLAVRLGGDEFALLLPGVDALPQALDRADRLIASVSQPVLVEGQSMTIGASVGIAITRLHGVGAEEIISNADLALHQAKAEGRHCSRPYHPGLRAEARSKMSRDTELRQALDRGEFELFYQPQICLRDGALTGAEALLRWNHPQRGLLSPAEFLPALEAGRLAAPVGDWVVETACRQATVWRRQGARGFRMSVNLFGAQFRSGNLLPMVTGALAAASLPPDALELEITENVILRHEDQIVAPLRALRAQGIGISFDDYGTGYASLSLLKRYPLTRLKIDQSFARSASESPSDAAIVGAIVSLARAFDLGVIAEGVETQAQADFVAQSGCQEAQGYLFGKPMSAADFTRKMGHAERAHIAVV